MNEVCVVRPSMLSVRVSCIAVLVTLPVMILTSDSVLCCLLTGLTSTPLTLVFIKVVLSPCSTIYNGWDHFHLWIYARVSCHLVWSNDNKCIYLSDTTPAYGCLSHGCDVWFLCDGNGHRLDDFVVDGTTRLIWNSCGAIVGCLPFLTLSLLMSTELLAVYLNECILSTLPFWQKKVLRLGSTDPRCMTRRGFLLTVV